MELCVLKSLKAEVQLIVFSTASFLSVLWCYLTRSCFFKHAMLQVNQRKSLRCISTVRDYLCGITRGVLRHSYPYMSTCFFKSFQCRSLFQAPVRIGVIFKHLRKLIDSLLEKKLENPRMNLEGKAKHPHSNFFSDTNLHDSTA